MHTTHIYRLSTPYGTEEGFGSHKYQIIHFIFTCLTKKSEEPWSVLEFNIALGDTVTLGWEWQIDVAGGQEAVTTMVNYTTATTRWGTVNGRDADKEIDSGTSRTVPQPEDA